MVDKCGGCGTGIPGGEVCPECGRPQPFAPGTDHWTALGLERRLDLERGDLETRVHELNRRFHPDYFRLRAPEEQAVSLESSATVNTAYRILRDPVTRVEYLLAQEGMRPGAARPPADLFEEILELQEARQELATAGPDEAPARRGRLAAARDELAARRAATERDLAVRFPAWDTGDEPARNRLLGEMRDLLAVRAYLRTVLRDLNAALGNGDAEGRTD